MSEPDDTVDPNPEAAPQPFLRRDQILLLVFLPGCITAIYVGMLLFKRDYAALLYQHPLGVKMLTVALVDLAIGQVTFLVYFILVNRLGGERVVPSGIRFLVIVAALLLFYLPVVFVILVGPAAIQITESLR
jgi:hypothetical protein